MPTIPSFRGHWAFLSNFHPSRLLYKGRWYSTAEHAYQATKMTCQVHHDWILACTTPGQAKHRTRNLPLRKDWEQVKDGIMLDILRAKFSDPDYAELLLETGTHELVEHNPWHDKLLMQVRNELKTQERTQP